MDWLAQEVKALKNSSLYRSRKFVDGVLDLCSNDYLALRDNPEVVRAVKEALENYGLGSGASQLVSGYTKAHTELEEYLSKFKGTPSCVLFGSGYLANLGTIQALVGEGDLILSDELNHASIIDACRLSKAERKVFKHADYGELERTLKKLRHRYNRVLIVTDGVFSMEGDLAYIPELYRICEKYDCMLYIDEAHSTGTIGEGYGILREFKLEWKEFVVLMGTLSKAVGAYGAFVCGSTELAEYLVNRARTLIFSTSLPPPICAGAKKSLEIIDSSEELSLRLRRLAGRLYSELKDIGFEVSFHGTPILPIMIGEEEKALNISKRLLERGIFVQAIRYPTVPKGRARLRLTASLRYKEEEISLLLNNLKALR